MSGTGTLRAGLCRENETLIRELSIPAPGSKDLHFETRYPQSALSQFRLIFWKCGLHTTRVRDASLVVSVTRCVMPQTSGPD